MKDSPRYIGRIELLKVTAGFFIVMLLLPEIIHLIRSVADEIDYLPKGGNAIYAILRFAYENLPETGIAIVLTFGTGYFAGAYAGMRILVRKRNSFLSAFVAFYLVLVVFLLTWNTIVYIENTDFFEGHYDASRYWIDYLLSIGIAAVLSIIPGLILGRRIKNRTLLPEGGPIDKLN